RTRMTFLPPISRQVCLKEAAEVFETSRPTSVEPVKETRRASGWRTRGEPTSLPVPVTRFTTPRGRPASSRIWTRLYAESGVSWAGLSTTVLPHISAGMVFQEGMAIGKFHGVIKAATPIEERTVMQNLFS